MFLGIDVGTQSVRTLLYDGQDRRVVGLHSAPLELISKADGTREQLAHSWLGALDRCMASIDKRHKTAVKAIGVSGQQHGFVPLCAGGRVLAPVKLWCDTATVAECSQITERFGGTQRCIAEVGNAILPGYTAPKIRWLKNHRPEAYAQLATILLPHDYINFHLTGELAMEYGDASGTGLLDIRQREWHAGMLCALDAQRDLRGALPPLVQPGSVIGRLRMEVSAQWGLPANTPVATGGGDNMMAAIGTGNVCSGRLTASLGSSGTLFASCDRPIIDPRGAVAAFCSSTGGWLPLLCTMNCTVSSELTRRLFGLDIAQLEKLALSVPAGSNGVMTLPFFNGERSPNLPQGKGCILGLDAGNYLPENLLRSAMESAIYALRTGRDAFVELGCAFDTVRLTGGGAGSSVWRQMVADILELPVSVQTVDEGAALGAALQAFWTWQREQGDTTNLQALVDEQLTPDLARSCEPRAAEAAIYNSCYEEYSRHVATVTPLYA